MARRKISVNLKEVLLQRLVPIVLGITGLLYLLAGDYLGGFIFLAVTAWFWFKGGELKDEVGRRSKWGLKVFTIMGSIFLISLLLNMIRGLF
jgi:hypothetical protein